MCLAVAGFGFSRVENVEIEAAATLGSVGVVLLQEPERARRVLQKTRATPLPDESAMLGQPFAGFQSLVLYHRDVLPIDGDAL